MDTLADSELLHLWESMRRQTLPRQAAALLALAAPDMASGQLAGLSLGERERRLLALHARCFGARLPCVADCPQCGEAFEFELDARALAAGLPAPGTNADGAVNSAVTPASAIGNTGSAGQWRTIAVRVAGLGCEVPS